MWSATEAIWLATLSLIHFLYVPTVLSPVPSSSWTNLLTATPYPNYQQGCFSFCLLSRVLVCLPQLHKHQGMPAECFNSLESTAKPMSLARVQIFALLVSFLFQAWWISPYFLQLWLSKESHTDLDFHVPIELSAFVWLLFLFTPFASYSTSSCGSSR